MRFSFLPDCCGIGCGLKRWFSLGSALADEATVKQLALTDRSSALAARRGNKQIGLHNGPERSINVDSTAIRQSATSIK